MNGETLKGLLVEDNRGDARLVRELLSETVGSEFEVVHVVCLAEALKRLAETRFEFILLDLELPDSQGFDTFVQMHEHAPAVPIVVLSGLNDQALALDAVRAGAQDYFVKGQLIGSRLARSVRYAVERMHAAEALRRALAEADKRRAESEALLASARSVLEHHSFPDAARAIFDRCKKLLGAQAGYVALPSPDGGENEVLFLDSGGQSCTVDSDFPMSIRGLHAQVYETGKPVYDNSFGSSECKRQSPEGHTIPRSVLLAPLKIKGEIVGLLGLADKPGGFTDNDARLAAAFGQFASVALQNSRTLESLEASERRFRSVVETAGDAVITMDAKGDVIFWNQAAEAIFGLSRREIIGRPIICLIPDRFRRTHREAVESLVATGEGNVVGTMVELVGLRKDGSEFPLELSLTAWKIGGEQLFTGIIRDISDRKRAEETLHRAHDELEVRVAERTAELTETGARLQREAGARMRAEEELAAWNSRYQAAIEATGHILYDWDPRTGAVIWGGSVKATLGYEIHELGGSDHWFQCVVHPADTEAVRRELERSLAERVLFQAEYRARRKDGEYISVEARGRFIIDAAGNPVRMLGFVADITPRKRAEQAHRLDEARLKALVKLNDMADARFEQVADFALEEAVELTESDLGFLGFMNDSESVMTIHAWSGKAMEQCQIADKPREFPIVEAGLWAEAIRQRQPVVVNDYSVSKTWKQGYPEGHVSVARVLVVPVFDGERIVAVAAVANKKGSYEEGDTRQVSLLMQGMWRLVQRQRAGAALQESEARLTNAQRIARMGSWDWNILTNELHWSDEIYWIFGLAPQAFGATYDAFLASVHPSDRGHVQKHVDAALHGDAEYDIDHRIVLPGGEVRHVHEKGEVTRDQLGRAVCMVGTVMDITDRKQAEEEVRRVTGFLQNVIDEIPEALTVIDRDHHIVLANRAVREMVGGKDPVAEHIPCYKVFHNRDAPCSDDGHSCELHAVIKERRTLETTHTHLETDGEEVVVDIVAAPISDENGEVRGVIKVCRDVTARVRAEQRLRQHEAELAHVARLSAMGELASNLAHELTQPLATIVNYVQACIIRVRSGRSDLTTFLADMERVAAQAKSAGDIIHGMRSFLRKGRPQQELVSINDLVHASAGLLKFELHAAEVEMCLELGDGLPPILVEAIQIEQVMVNLMRNAIEAAKDGSGIAAQIVVRTSAINGTVEFAVRDWGPGLSAEAVKHLFEPFFTTKPEGMGMGLSISRTIIESHGGRLAADIHPEGGCTFRFTLPVDGRQQT